MNLLFQASLTRRNRPFLALPDALSFLSLVGFVAVRRTLLKMGGASRC